MLETERLTLRQWQKGDLSPFAQLNADVEVMKHFPKTLSISESDALANKCKDLIAKNGWGFWAIELKDTQEFIGMLGLNKVKPNLPFYPCVEIGWRLHKPFWKNGYATEGATRCLKFAFDTLQLEHVIAFTSKTNQPSQRVMQRLGMKNTQQNFNHPDIPAQSPLAEHVLYQVNAHEFF